MGMPVITPCTGTRCQAITDIIESVALEQTALSHILNAEGEKLQKILSLSNTSTEILAGNSSVLSMVNAITRLEMVLQSKLELFNGSLTTDCSTTTTTSSGSSTTSTTSDDPTTGTDSTTTS